MKTSLCLATISVLLLVSSPPVLDAQPPNADADLTIDADTRSLVIDGVSKALTDFYVFPDVAGRMVQDLSQRRQRHEYRLDHQRAPVCPDAHRATHRGEP